VDIGVEPFLISSSVVAVIAQRLVRVLCDHCKEAYTPGVILENIGITQAQLSTHTLYQAKGCEKCFNTGYRGRIGIFEIMHMREELRNLILKTYDTSQIKQYAMQYNMKTLRQSGIDKVLAGTTTIEEVLRVTQQ
jgi:general secretion pathway protein E